MASPSIKDAAKVTPEQVTKVMKTEEKPVITQKIYVGPNLLGLPTYTVIENEFTEHIKNFIKDCTEVGKLFVPIAEMANTENRVKEKGTLEHRHYQKIMAFKNASRKGDQ